MTTTAVRFENVSYTYPTGDAPALHAIDLEILSGEYVAIMGLNGAGKTTLGLCINGVVPTMLAGTLEGTVTVDGLDVSEYPVREMSKVVGMVFDNPEFQMSQATVADEVALGLESNGVDPADMDELIDDALRRVGLAGLQERSPFSLSGGQQQRLAIAAVLAMRPKVMVLDEPTSNLDPVGKDEVFEMAAALNTENGMTVVMIEHEVDVMARYADRVIVMDHGAIVMNGAPQDILARVHDLAALGLRAPDVAAVTASLNDRLDLDLAVPVTLEPAVELLRSVTGAA